MKTEFWLADFAAVYRTQAAPATGEEKTAAQSTGAEDPDGRYDTFERTGGAQAESAEEPAGVGDITVSSSLEDETARLTKELVNAFAEMDVRMVVSKANKSMMSLRIAAAMGDAQTKKKAEALLAKMSKLMDRAFTKIKDLREETELAFREKCARKTRQRERADEIKAELRQKERMRREKEQKYLRESESESGHADQMLRAQEAFATPDAAMSDAAIAAQAEAQAAAEVSVFSGAAVAGGADSPAAVTPGDAADAVAAGEAAAVSAE